MNKKIMASVNFSSIDQCVKWLQSSERTESEILDANTWGALLMLGSYACVQVWLKSTPRVLQCYDVNQLFRDAAYFSEDDIAWGLMEDFSSEIPDDNSFRSLVRSCFLKKPDGSPLDLRQRNDVLNRLSRSGRDVEVFKS